MLNLHSTLLKSFRDSWELFVGGFDDFSKRERRDRKGR